ncbi:hypothetical protein HDC95_002895 [Microbacterium sp. AK031]|nr:hypothetical protein [Microbacterium sp. AK031]
MRAHYGAHARRATHLSAQAPRHPRGADRPTAWINKGYVWFRNDDGTQDGIAFPENKLRDGGRNSRQRRREEAEKRICPTPGCGMVLPANGVCEYC